MHRNKSTLVLDTSLCSEEVSIPQQHLKKGRVHFGSQPKSAVHHSGEGVVATPEAAGPGESVVRREREMNAGAHLLFPPSIAILSRTHSP